LISPDHATCRSDLPRERFSPLTRNGHHVRESSTADIGALAGQATGDGVAGRPLWRFIMSAL
jgi:hypothetical protein